MARICHGWADVLPPHDEFYGSDLQDDEEFVAMAEQTPEDLPDWKHFAPPCRTYTKARRTDKHGKVKRLRSEEKPEGFGCEDTKAANSLVDRAAYLCEKQHQEDKYFSIENPWESFIWEQKPMKRLAKLPGTRLLRLDQCAYGGPYHKPHPGWTKDSCAKGLPPTNIRCWKDECGPLK